MRKFKLWPERTVDHRGHLIIPEPVDVVAEDWQLVDGALLFSRDNRNWIAVAKGAWSMLREVTEAGASGS